MQGKSEMGVSDMKTEERRGVNTKEDVKVKVIRNTEIEGKGRGGYNKMKTK